MGIVQIGFVWPHNFLGEVIDFAEGKGSQPSHVFVVMPPLIEDYILEAIAEGVVFRPVKKYAGVKVRIVPVEVPYPELFYAACFLMEGDKYSIAGCAQAVIHDLTDISIPLGSGSAQFCSEVAARALRCGGLYDLHPGHPAKVVEPYQLLIELDKTKGDACD